VVHVPQKWYVCHRSISSLEPAFHLQSEICISWPVSISTLCPCQHFFEEMPVIGRTCGPRVRFPSKRSTSGTSFCKCSSTRVFSQAKAVWRDYVPAQRTVIMIGTIVWYVRRAGRSCGQLWGDYAGMMLDRSSRLCVELISYFSS
jgi:hypothetical protein